MGGAGPIPFTAVERYAARYGLESDCFESFLALMKRMDRTYLEQLATKAEK